MGLERGRGRTPLARTCRALWFGRGDLSVCGGPQTSDRNALRSGSSSFAHGLKRLGPTQHAEEVRVLRWPQAPWSGYARAASSRFAYGLKRRPGLKAKTPPPGGWGCGGSWWDGGDHAGGGAQKTRPLWWVGRVRCGGNAASQRRGCRENRRFERLFHGRSDQTSGIGTARSESRTVAREGSCGRCHLP